MREYHSVNKQAWGAGAWQDEPDKVQWVDEATGLDCLMVRGPHGGWCGYVGVSESHPWFGKDYNQCTQQPACEESWCGHSPECRVRVHGGITFADSCHEPSRENWEHWCENMRKRAADAKKYPNGDSARAWREQGHLLEDYEAWRAFGESRFICHIPESDRPDRVWWFGFDCAHYGDYSPAHVGLGLSVFRDGVYRDRAYVEGEIRSLAQQLADAQ